MTAHDEDHVDHSQVYSQAYLMCVTLDRYAECTTQSQISYLQTLCVIIYQQILWLQVTVHDTVLVAVRSTLDKLVHKTLHIKHKL